VAVLPHSDAEAKYKGRETIDQREVRGSLAFCFVVLSVDIYGRCIPYHIILLIILCVLLVLLFWARIMC
jgi:hypothetical protein